MFAPKKIPAQRIVRDGFLCETLSAISLEIRQVAGPGQGVDHSGCDKGAKGQHRVDPNGVVRHQFNPRTPKVI